MIDCPRPARLLAIVLLLSAAVVGNAPYAYAWGNDTHSRNASPDYERVFPKDRVNRLDIRIAAADWQRIVSDMTEMVGPFGAGTKIDPAAIEACQGKVEADACSFGTPLRQGRCHFIPEGPLACIKFGGGSGDHGSADVDFLPRTPVYVRATVKLGNTEFHDVGLRLKGNSSLVNSWRDGVEKLPLRLNFDEFERQVPAVTNQTFFGFPDVSLTNNGMDRSFLRAKVVSDLLAEAGIPAPRATYVRVYLDRGEGPAYWGLYTMLEVPDRPLLRKHFGSDDGNLYKPRGEAARWTKFDRQSFPKKTNAAAEDWTDIENAITALNASRADPRVWRARLEARFGVSGFLRWLAFNTIVGNSDAYGGFIPHNYYLYGSPRHRDRLFWIPWDHDLAMETGAVLLPPPPGGPGPLLAAARGPRAETSDDPPSRLPPGGLEPQLDLFHERTDASWPLIRFLLDDPTYRAAYRQQVEQIIATVFVPDRVSAKLLADYALISRYVVGPEGERPERTFLQSPQDFEDALHGPNGLLQYVSKRYGDVLRQLEDE